MKLSRTVWRAPGFASGVAAVAVYALLMTFAVPEPILLGWTLMAVIGTVVSPVFGLTVLAAIGPFTGAVDDDGQITAVPVLLAATGVALLVQLAVTRPLPRFRWPLPMAAWTVPLAVLLMAGTALGVVHSWLAYGPEHGREAAELWVPGIGGAMTVFVASAWVAWRGETRPLLVAVASVTVAAALSLLDFISVGGVNASPLGWLLHDQLDWTRLGGIILAPNAAAAIFLVGLSVSSAAALMLKSPPVRLVAAASALLSLIAVVLTYSRSALIALGLAVFVLAWRWRRWVGIGLAALVGVVAVAGYAILSNGDLLRSVPDVVDQQRLDAWGAAFRMWHDQPLIGAGFRSFEWLYAQYGSVLDAPHNEWLRLLAEGGTLIGLAGVAFAGLIAIALFKSPGWIGAGVAAGAVALVAMASFNNPFLYAQLNVPAFIAIGIGIGVAARDVGEPAQPESATPAPGRARWPGWLIEIAAGVVITIVGYVVITTFVAQPYEVQQPSMRATLDEGQYVLVDKLTPHFDGYSRGDIVVFNRVKRASCSDPAVFPLEDPTPYIKRVIGEPGDHVELREGGVYINGILISEPYVRGAETGALVTSWVVPQERLFVMGDNRAESIDSRSDEIGAICVNDVVGRAFLRYWPPNRFGILQTPTYNSTPSPSAAVATPVPVKSTPAAPGTTSSASPRPPVEVELLRVEVIERRPHDVTSYTQGLVMVDNRLYEGNGYGEATLREVDPDTGVVLRAITIDSQYWGEGIAVVDDRLIQLTWQQHTALVYNLSDFRQIATFSYDTEGWGLCDDGTRLVMSDGTSQLYFRNRSTFELIGAVTVTSEGQVIQGLNELECVDGLVYANVYPTSTIVRIDPSSGEVNAEIDASGLLSAGEGGGEEEVLNGIAYDKMAGTFLLTGKLWPAMFEVRFVPR